MPDENGINRRERNENFGQESGPALEIPFSGYYIWEWFEEIKSSVGRISDGVCRRIQPSEFLAWASVNGHIVQPFEYAILREMDGAYCTAMNEELAAYRAREEERRAQEAKSKGKRR